MADERIPQEAKPACRIENWHTTRLGDGNERLDGTVFGHPDPMFPDGSRIITSAIVLIDEDAEFAETRNSIYHLGARAHQ